MTFDTSDIEDAVREQIAARMTGRKYRGRLDDGTRYVVKLLSVEIISLDVEWLGLVVDGKEVRTVKRVE